MDIDEGKVKRTKARVLEVNAVAKKCIYYSQILCDTVYKSEEKFGFVQAVLNMELQCASKYAKLVEKDTMSHIENLKMAVKSYENARKFLNEYKAEKKFKTNEEMGKDLAMQYNLCDEMIQLLPEKISRLHQLEVGIQAGKSGAAQSAAADQSRDHQTVTEMNQMRMQLN